MESYWVFIFIALIVVVGFVIAHLAAEKRRKDLAELAERAGLFFSAYTDDVHSIYYGFTPFGSGSGRRSTNLLHGQRGEVRWQIFDYRYTTGSGKNRKTHHYGIAAAHVPLRLKRLAIRPEGWFDKIASMVGFDDINFESEEFSRQYHVSCSVRKFAYDLIHPQMIEFLLTCQRRHWQMEGDVVLLHKSGRFSAYELEEVLTMVEGFVQRIPPYVRQDIGHESLVRR